MLYQFAALNRFGGCAKFGDFAGQVHRLGPPVRHWCRKPCRLAALCSIRAAQTSLFLLFEGDWNVSFQAQLSPVVARDAQRLFQREHERVCRRTDRLISLVMTLQWPGAVVAALLIGSPHPSFRDCFFPQWSSLPVAAQAHLAAAIYFGGLVTVAPILLAWLRPGSRLTRHTMAACQMMMSGLMIHISGGRTETHFHVFGSLAFLAFYLDWPVLVTATGVFLVDHFIIGAFVPMALFGSASESNLRLAEHIFWVLFCDGFLITSCLQSLKGLRVAAAREAEQEVLLHQAYHDSLTGLGNRLLMEKRIGEAMERSPAEEHLALMAIDLDRFKEVNDTLGHQAGDHVLRQVSARLCALVSSTDTLARMGGDEFALLLGSGRHAAAEPLAAAVVEALNQPIFWRHQRISIGVSIGVCVCSADRRIEQPELFQRADLALYKAKNGGRNHYLVFDEAMRTETLHQMSLEHRLRTAVADGAMQLHYQPIVNAAGGLLGFEALLRWQDAVHGSVSPVQFIPLAEKNGLIVRLGEWVLREACTQAARWHGAGGGFVKMSVNISSIQLADAGFVEMVLAILKESGLPPELLDLELTESTLIQNHAEVRERLHLLRSFGVRLSIDDFGTGYSSLSYLRDLPVHTLKIDRAFVRDITCSAEARVLIEGMIEMAHSLRLKVVAEGVEDHAQMTLLARAGCDEIQGFHISRAVPAGDAESLMRVGSNSRETSITVAPAARRLSLAFSS